MRYRLQPPYTLRGWQGFPRALCTVGVQSPTPLSPKSFALLEACDGETELAESPLLSRYLTMGVIAPSDGTQRILSEQRYRYFNNRFYYGVSFAPTGRCNYNCRHCFMAKDENPSIEQWGYDECQSLLEQMQACGIGNLRLTGGEPLLHPDFIKIVKKAEDCGIRVKEVLTNGSLVSQQMLDGLHDCGAYPLIMISFDGIGKHDWLRGIPGAEQSALRAIELCKKNGFNVSVHICIHNENVEALFPTAELLSALGVDVLRIIRVCESPRWMRTSSDANMPPEEYFEAMLDFLKRYKQARLLPMVEIWHTLRYFPREDRVAFIGELASASTDPCSVPACVSARSYLHISYDGGVFPCNEASGYMRSRGDEVQNIKRSSLQEVLASSSAVKLACKTLQDHYSANPDCAICEFRTKCLGGCRAVAYATTGNYLGIDYAKCRYFKEGYYRRFQELFDDR